MTASETASALVGEWIQMCQEADVSGELVVWYSHGKRSVALALFVEASELQPVYFRPTGTDFGDISPEDARKMLMPLWKRLCDE